ncbi:MAG: sigma-70 family RNA polymerase sigma factor, partial [Planctomycetes bacterium]|nr:sigma-70 family RNA polymerase sigma factor [Planctomycetota bacterium]
MSSSPTNPPAPEELLEHVAFVRQLARGLVYGEDRVDDVVQQSFLRALKSPPKHRGNLRSWFAVVVRNVVYREAGRTRVREDAQWGAVEESGAAEAADRAAERADFQRSISEAVHELPEPFRTVVVLRYFDELSIDEIAEHLGVPRETVRSRQRRGLARLREHLARDDRRTGGDWRASALALLGEPAPSPDLSLASTASWWLPLAVSLPLVMLGGAWWWTSSSNDVPDRAVEPIGAVGRDAASVGDGEDRESAAEREALAAVDSALEAGAARARITDLYEGLPLEGASLVVGVRSGEVWKLAELSADADGECRGAFRPVDALPSGLEFVLGTNAPRSFAFARAVGHAPLRVAPLPAAARPAAEALSGLGVGGRGRGVWERGGVVRDADGSAVSGARLWLSDDGGESGNADRAVAVGVTGANGRFTLDELIAPNRFAPYTWTLFAEHDGRCGWRKLQLDALATEVEVEVELGPYAALDLTVLDEADEPLVGATVRALTFHAPWSKEGAGDALLGGAGGPLHRNFEGVTDASGRVFFEALPARDDTLSALAGSDPARGRRGGPYELRIESAGRSVRVVDEFSLPVGERSELTVRLAQLTASDRPGRVVSAQDGRVLRDAWVRAPELERRIAVDEHGTFVLPHDFPRRIEVGAPGHLTRAFDWSEADTTARDCELEPALELRG